MSDKSLRVVLVVLAVVAVIGGGIWYFTSNPYPQTAQTATNTNVESSTASGTGTNGSSVAAPVSQTTGVGSIQNLIAMNKDLACSINLVAAKTSRSGSIYVAAGMMRADLFSTTAGQTKAVSMIDNGTSLYLWTDDASTGIKLSKPISASGSNIAQNGGIDPVTNFSYVCHPWKVDANFFVAPTAIAFSAQ
jgi:hypothetical protein